MIVQGATHLGRWTIVVVALLILVVNVGPTIGAEAPANLSGTYRNDGVVLMLQADDAVAGGYRGTVQTGGQTYALKAKAVDGKIVGTFADNENNAFDFTAMPEAGGMTVQSGGATHHLRAAAVNPLIGVAPVGQKTWLHEGLVLTSDWTTIVGNGGGGYTEDENGAWHDNGGQLFEGGTSASGFSQATVTCIDGDKAAISLQGFSGPGLQAQDPMPLGAPNTMLVSVVEAGDFWVDPAQLAKAKPSVPDHKLVDAVQWKRGGQAFDAVRIQIVKDGQFNDHIFDRKTGLCLHFAMTAHGNDQRGGPINTLTHGNFISARDTKIPWAGEATPEWVAGLKSLNYRGAILFRGSPLPTTNTIISDLAAGNHGAGWIAMTLRLDVRWQNTPALPATQTQVIYGRTQYHNMWAGPAALARLHEGQVLDEDPITKMKTVVSKADEQAVQITSANSSGEIISNYDRRTGIRLGASFYNDASKQQWVVKLQSHDP